MNPLVTEASLTGLFRLALVILTVYVVFKFFVRFIFPSLLRNYVQGMQDKFAQQQPEKYSNGKEGDISITVMEKDKKRPASSDAGEYVDYEEIK
jgi:maltodextrin utilization protein YvdJ